MTTARRAAAGLSALVSCVLMLVIGSPVALANVGPPDPSTTTLPERVTTVAVDQTSGFSVLAVILIALAAAGLGALATMATVRLARMHRTPMLPA
jgi:hypothetical protein